MSANTNAEQFADQGKTLPGFNNLSLPGIKEQVAQILALTGRGETKWRSKNQNSTR
jgi:hypothetical protein